MNTENDKPNASDAENFRAPIDSSETTDKKDKIPVEKWEIVSSRKATWQQLKEILETENRDWRKVAAKNPNIPPSELEKLAEDPDPIVVGSVAENPSTPKEILYKFAEAALSDSGHDYYIQAKLLDNPELPPELFEKILSETRYWIIIREAARNPHTPEKALVALLDKKFVEGREIYKEESWYDREKKWTPEESLSHVQEQITQRPNITPEFARTIASNPRLAYLLAENTQLPRAALDELYENPDHRVRDAVSRTIDTINDQKAYFESLDEQK